MSQRCKNFCIAFMYPVLLSLYCVVFPFLSRLAELHAIVSQAEAEEEAETGENSQKGGSGSVLAEVALHWETLSVGFDSQMVTL